MLPVGTEISRSFDIKDFRSILRSLSKRFEIIIKRQVRRRFLLLTTFLKIFNLDFARVKAHRRQVGTIDNQ